MISSLGINDLGVISSARIDLGPGLTVVTGETGAGKTMFVTALDLLTGARADAHVVRKDAERAVVEGVFDLTAVTPEVAGRLAEGVRVLVLAPQSPSILLRCAAWVWEE